MRVAATALLTSVLVSIAVACGSEVESPASASPGGDDGVENPDLEASAAADGGGRVGDSGIRDDGPTGPGDGGGDAGLGDGGALGPDGGGTGVEVLTCGAHSWRDAAPASGVAMMAHGSKAYLFAADGLTWTVIENGIATTAPIPLPAGLSKMQSVVVEMAPSRRSFVSFTSDGQRWGAFFDGSVFVKTTALGAATEAHADALERIYAKTPSGLVEVTPGSTPIPRGLFPKTPKAWTVAADGTVYVLYTVTQPNDWRELRSIRLSHGSGSWGDDVLVTSNNGWGFTTVGFAAAPDGSLHAAYVPIGVYARSQDGLAWQTEQFVGTTKATMIDPTTPGIDGVDPAKVTGSPYLVAAQDYDRASITLVYNGGSFSRPSYYFLRRCTPMTPTSGWPAERLILSSGDAFAPTPIAVSQTGLPTIFTFYGVRQDVP